LGRTQSILVRVDWVSGRSRGKVGKHGGEKPPSRPRRKGRTPGELRHRHNQQVEANKASFEGGGRKGEKKERPRGPTKKAPTTLDMPPYMGFWASKTLIER